MENFFLANFGERQSNCGNLLNVLYYKKLGAGVDNKMNNFIQLIFSMLWPIQLPWLSVLANIDLTDIRRRLTFPWAKYILTYIG